MHLLVAMESVLSRGLEAKNMCILHVFRFETPWPNGFLGQLSISDFTNETVTLSLLDMYSSHTVSLLLFYLQYPWRVPYLLLSLAVDPDVFLVSSAHIEYPRINLFILRVDQK